MDCDRSTRVGREALIAGECVSEALNHSVYGVATNLCIQREAKCIRVRTPGHPRRRRTKQTAILSTDYARLAASMFARWSQENFFRYMRQHYGLDRLVLLAGCFEGLYFDVWDYQTMVVNLQDIHLSEGRGEVFFLDILFYRMSDIAMFQQRRAPFLVRPPRARGEFAGGQLRRDLKHRPVGRAEVVAGGSPKEIPCWVENHASKRVSSSLVEEGVQHCLLPSAVRVRR
jgi:hypothetical protein